MDKYNLYLSAFLAFIPLLWLLFSLGYLKMVAYKAVPLGLLLTLFLSMFYFNFSIIETKSALIQGVNYAIFPILWVIIAAIYTYNLSVKTGAIHTIKEMLTSVSKDHRILALILAFSFGGFLEAAAGFGTAVAIPAGILVSLGFSPLLAAVICLIANSVPVAFGALGIPVMALQEVTNLSLNLLSKSIALQLLLFSLILPFIIVILITKSIKGLKGVFIHVLITGVSFTFAQTLTAIFLGPELPAVVGSIFSLITLIIYVKTFPIKQFWTVNEKILSEAPKSISLRDGILSWSSYGLLLIFIILSQIYLKVLPSSNTTSSLQEFILSPGTLMFASAVLGGKLQGANLTDLLVVFKDTLKQLIKTIITIVSIVSMATLLKNSHMVTPIAEVLAQTTHSFYPFIAPFLGALGTFITGSDTSSNLLFGALQYQTAIEIGANPTWIAASNTAGATAGKMISPQSITIAASATGLIGKEGEILSKMLKYCLGYIFILGILVYIVNLFL